MYKIFMVGFFLFFILIFTSCSTKNSSCICDINEVNKNFSNTPNNKGKSGEHLALPSKKGIATNLKVKPKVSKSIQATKRMRAETLLLKRKLLISKVHFGDYADRSKQDNTLLKKLVKVRNEIRSYAKGYILHSTKFKRYRSYTKGKHVYLKYSSSSSQIKDYLRILHNHTTYKSYASKQKNYNVVKKDVPLTVFRNTVKQKLKVLTTGDPYFRAK